MSRSLLDAWLPRPLLLRADGLWDGQRDWAGFAEWCAAHPRRRCTLWLSSALLHELVCDDVLAGADDAGALAWARPLLQHYHGDAALGWPLAAWHHGRQRGVSALHGVALPALQAAADRSRVRLHGVRPWWSLVLARARSGSAVLRGPRARLLVVEGDRVSALMLRDGRLAGIDLRRLDGPDPAALAAWQADAPALPTVAAGYGLRPGSVAGVYTLQRLDTERPLPVWLERRGL